MNSLAVKWVGLCASTLEGMGSTPGRGTKNLRAMRSSKKKKKQNQKHNEVLLPTDWNGQNQDDCHSKYWQRCGETGTLINCWWECEMIDLLWETVWQLFFF